MKEITNKGYRERRTGREMKERKGLKERERCLYFRIEFLRSERCVCE